MVSKRGPHGHPGGRLVAEGELEPFVEPSPDGRVDQLRVVGGGDQRRFAFPPIDLLQEHGDDTPHLADVVVAFSAGRHGVELVEEQHAGTSPCKGEGSLQARSRLAEAGTDDRRQVERVEGDVRVRWRVGARSASCRHPVGR